MSSNPARSPFLGRRQVRVLLVLTAAVALAPALLWTGSARHDVLPTPARADDERPPPGSADSPARRRWSQPPDDRQGSSELDVPPAEDASGEAPGDDAGNRGASSFESSVGSSSSSGRRGVFSARYANGAAIQAPPFPRVPLFGTSEADVSAGAAQIAIDEADATAKQLPSPGSRDALCWDRTGDPVPVPKWVVAFFATVESEVHYRALADAADNDMWALLLAWVPQRFMPPQPDGKNAAGQVIKAPTRGRDPNFYLQEYNATWHTTRDVDQLKYHFQLVNRNALAVCIRERLHTTTIRCAPRAGLPPALLHHCLCRKCVEAQSHNPVREKGGKAKVGRIPGWTEANAHRPLMLPKALVDSTPFLQRKPRVIAGLTKSKKEKPVTRPPYSGKCVQALSAPWLVDNVTVPKFAYEGLESNLDALLEVQADENGIVLVCMFNKFWLDHLHNFYFSMVRRGTIANIIVGTLDPQALAVCKANRMPCFDASDYAEVEEDMVEGGEGYKKGSTRKVTEAMSWIKPRLAVAVLERGYGFFMVDLDMTWNGWPMRDVLDVGTDLTHQCDADSKSSINSGFYLARPNYRTWMFFRNLMVLRPEENSDQTAMKLFSRYDHTHGMSNACLDKWRFNMKCNYKKTGSVKRTKDVPPKETFEWVPFERDRSKFFWHILHATCINGALSKVLYLRTMNAWFLDDLDDMTEQPYCLELPSGGTAEDATARTQHSASYTKDTDKKFLASRH